MRLRLRIERNEIPTANVLWTIDDTTERRQTIAQFLNKVNERIPLEGETWGLEDYTVSVGGYEALHYSEVGTTFQHEDEVCIKPLQFVEAKSRLLSGRDQITPDGRHLHDGVAFGRPLVRKVVRPDVYIPPRKKPRLDNEEAGALVRMEEEDEDSDDDDDEDFDGEYDDGDIDEDSEEEEDASAQPRIPAVPEQVDGSDDSSSGSSSSDSNSESNSESSSDDSSSESDSESDEEEQAWDGLDGEAPSAGSAKPSNEQPPLVNGHQEVDGTSAPPGNTAKGIPHGGQAVTKARNQRRREQRQLKVLKEAGLLPSNATFDTLHNWQKEKNATSGPAARAIIIEQLTIETERQKLLDQITSGGVDINGAANHGPAASDAAEVTADETTHSRSKSLDEPIMRDQDEDELPEVEPATAQQRKRLDLASTNRLVFGSLGVRNPKTQADKDALQKRLAGGTKRKATTALQPAQPEEEEDEDAWRTKIELSAVECCDEGVNLSVPPFPFQQRWDPQYRLPKKKRNKRRKVEANGAAHAQFTETYDKYNQNGGGDALDYDDPSEDVEDDSYWEEGALLENGDDDEGFPPLPVDDVGILPSVVAADLSVGDFVVFTELACSAATGWQPKTITGTVRLDVKDDDGWTGKLAPRDRAPKEFDEEGKRVYSKFEMEGASDDGADEDSKSFTLKEVKALKLLAKAGPAVELLPVAE
ncbi:hypothetical protein DOTSEDRAFT_70054 [Dothistroma septosporum NZE10]|uniref:DUF7357 domain-containing protein n=1 Tax=Dothistroma septosporum (strain NZE10 / CBS 128990) TaxID=675120 RepID=N1PU04_DOTSN|nr:hypothetical protein DOTSEDRAFT_70054 [Dothistroma septosporum NZE10]